MKNNKIIVLNVNKKPIFLIQNVNYVLNNALNVHLSYHANLAYKIYIYQIKNAKSVLKSAQIVLDQFV